MKKCNRDCFHCQYSDCILDDDDLTEEEIALSDALDERIKSDYAPDEDVVRWNRPGRPRKIHPKKETEQYREERRAYQREYYRKHKEEHIAYQREHNKDYYKKNREQLLAKSSARHKRLMQDPVYAEEYRRKARERYARRKKAV